MHQIIIKELVVETLIGVFDWERTRNTKLLIDLTLTTDFSAAMQSDDVADTISYAEVAEYVQDIGRISRFELLEALAKAIIDGICERFSISAVDITIIKPGILADAEKVGIHIFHQVN